MTVLIYFVIAFIIALFVGWYIAHKNLYKIRDLEDAFYVALICTFASVVWPVSLPFGVVWVAVGKGADLEN